MNTITIVHGLLAVPAKEFYAFKRTPEIMEWFASLGYGFHDLYDGHGDFATIVLDREQKGVPKFSNTSSLTGTDKLDITSLIEACLVSLHYKHTYEYR